MSLNVCMESHTNREYQAWIAYLEGQLNDPGLTEYYLMQIALEIRRGLMSNKKQWKLDDLKIDFIAEPPKHKSTKPVTDRSVADRSVADRSEASKARWFGLVGLKKEK